MKRSKLLKKLTKLVQKIIPVKKSRLLFTSFTGHYSDSPKYISQKINELAPHLEQVWLVKKQYLKTMPPHIKAVDIDNLFKSFWYRSTAHILIDNVYGEKEVYFEQNKMSRLRFCLLTFLNHKRRQQLFTTWHGTPLKKMGRDQIGKSISDFSCPNAAMLLGNQYTLDIMRHLTFGKIHMELLGTPRNDILFSSNDNKEKLREKLHLPRNKKIILFAPTFRSDDSNGIANRNIYRSGINQLRDIRFEDLFKTLSKKFGGDWVMVCRFHYHVESLVNWSELQEKYPNNIINGNACDDMAEYLACTDILLTDASSAMFDFAITKKPCFLFFPDVEHYQNAERGLYLDLAELPFKVTKTFSDLLKSITEFDETEYIPKTEVLLQRLGCVDDNRSSERIAEYIIEKSFR